MKLEKSLRKTGRNAKIIDPFLVAKCLYMTCLAGMTDKSSIAANEWGQISFPIIQTENFYYFNSNQEFNSKNLVIAVAFRLMNRSIVSYSTF